jgi:ribokinase
VTSAESAVADSAEVSSRDAAAMHSRPDPIAHSRVFVFGSLNLDLHVSVATLPRPGETIIGGDLRLLPGGKGANQAIAAARLGADVTMAGHVGGDDHGKILMEALVREGVSTQFVRVDASSRSGVALVLLDSHGENMIVVTSGANAVVDESDAAQALAEIRTGDVLVLQLEIPLDAVRAAAREASARGATVVLNAAPARDLDEDMLDNVDLLIVNEEEARSLFGSVERALATKRSIIVTLGARGAIVSHAVDTFQVPAPYVQPVDTTGAGDAFVGAIAAELARGTALADAVRVAVAAGAVATLGYGGQSALPHRDQLLDVIASTA